MSRHDLRDRIDELASLEGEGTELVTITVPPEKSIGTVRERVGSEHAAAENIKSDRTRERVKRALSRIQRLLREYPETPENGLVVCAGVVEGDLVSFVFDDLPGPIGESIYRCDDRFAVEPLRRVVAPDETFGLAVIERGGAAIGRLVGERVVTIRTVESRVMGSSRAGGQSARRFARERERQRHEFFADVAETVNDHFVREGDPVAGLAVGGTLTSAEAFVSGDYLDHRLRERLIGTFPVEYATERGLHQLVDRAESELLDAERREARKRVVEFFARLRDDEPVAYGDDEVERAVEFGAVDAVLLASEVPGGRRREFEDAVSEQGGETYVVSTDTERGARFASAFGGIGALLRFPVN